MTSNTYQPLPLSLYIHIPFCRKRCSYCAFNTYTDMDDQFEAYIGALIQEITSIGEGADSAPAHTIFLGGGTPSLLNPDQIARILIACREKFALPLDAEISMEMNPGTVTEQSLSGYRAAGVNRISFGVQSANPRELELFEREHTFEQAYQSFKTARRVGFDNINIDLIYGSPYQSLADWKHTLDAVLAWQPDHIALYSLSLEPGTPLRRRVTSGDVPKPNSDLAADMYEHAQDRLDAAGFVHYELSNWAKPGRECVHNKQYWLNEAFLGFGAGAHGATKDIRYWNIRPVEDYIGRITEGKLKPYPFSSAMYSHEESDPATILADTVILGLRLIHEGIDKVRFADRFGLSVEVAYGEVIEKHIKSGLLREDDTRITLTERGCLLHNQVAVDLLP